VVLRAALAAGALLVLAACSSSSGPKPADLPALQKAQEVRRVWSARIGTAGSFVFSPALVGDSVVVAARDGTVRRLAASDGKEGWRAELEYSCLPASALTRARWRWRQTRARCWS
jgi:outer membrane protein assembly factor BamB